MRKLEFCRNPSRGAFLFLVAILLLAGRSLLADEPSGPAASSTNLPEMIEADGRLRLSFGEERMVLPRGLQPSLLCTSSGTLILQAQVPDKPFPSNRMTYFSAMSTRVSRDGGASWLEIPLKPGENGLNMEGAPCSCATARSWRSTRTSCRVRSPMKGSANSIRQRMIGRPCRGRRMSRSNSLGLNSTARRMMAAAPTPPSRLHRRILELPNGDLLTTVYGWMKEDRTPAVYAPKMMKTRVMLARSADRGQHWKFVSTVAADSTVGTEGFGEPVIARLSKGRKPAA